jgi:hypothetical protein
MTQPIPQNWTRCQKEIDALLRFYDPEYETRTYLNPTIYIYDIADHPEKYPLLAGLTPQLQKRHISIFLKQSGRISRGNTIGAKKVWVLPGAKA